MKKVNIDLVKRLEQFRDAVKAQFNITIEIEFKQKYAHIVKYNSGSSSYCWIDLSNGNILKSASWVTPDTTGKTKGVRGNVFADDYGLSCLDDYGTIYLK